MTVKVSCRVCSKTPSRNVRLCTSHSNSLASCCVLTALFWDNVMAIVVDNNSSCNVSLCALYSLALLLCLSMSISAWAKASVNVSIVVFNCSIVVIEHFVDVLIVCFNASTSDVDSFNISLKLMFVALMLSNELNRLFCSLTCVANVWFFSSMVVFSSWVAFKFCTTASFVIPISFNSVRRVSTSSVSSFTWSIASPFAIANWPIFNVAVCIVSTSSKFVLFICSMFCSFSSFVCSISCKVTCSVSTSLFNVAFIVSTVIFSVFNELNTVLLCWALCSISSLWVDVNNWIRVACVSMFSWIVSSSFTTSWSCVDTNSFIFSSLISASVLCCCTTRFMMPISVSCAVLRVSSIKALFFSTSLISMLSSLVCNWLPWRVSSNSKWYLYSSSSCKRRKFSAFVTASANDLPKSTLFSLALANSHSICSISCTYAL